MHDFWETQIRNYLLIQSSILRNLAMSPSGHVLFGVPAFIRNGCRLYSGTAQESELIFRRGLALP